jgi:Rad3-related DNA helicase
MLEETRNIDKYFPLSDLPRPIQIKAFDKILRSFDTVDIVSISAPTGTGKSALGLALANYYESAWIVTPRVVLQHQYEKSFPFMTSIAGKKHYVCPISNASAEEADCCYGRCPLEPSRKEEGRYQRYVKALNSCKSELKNIWGTSNVKLETPSYKASDLVGASEDDDTSDAEASSRLLSTAKVCFRAKVANCPRFKDILTMTSNSKTCVNHGMLSVLRCGAGAPELNDCGCRNTDAQGRISFASYPIWARGTIRNLLVIDEAHHLAEMGRWIGTLKISSLGMYMIGMPTKFPKFKTPEEYMEYFEEMEVLDKTVQAITVTREMLSNLSMMDKNVAKQRQSLIYRLRVLEELHDCLGHVAFYIGNSEPGSYIVDWERGKLVLACVNPSWIIRHYLFSMGTKILLMSATMGSKETLCELLNLPDTDIKQFEVQSDWEFKERDNIYTVPLVSLAAFDKDKQPRDLTNDLDQAANAITSIAKLYKDARGLVFTTSYAQVQAIKSRLQDHSRFIFHERGQKLNDLLKELKYRDRAILISPSIYEGIDMKHEYCRFQIFIKLPWPSLVSRTDKTIYMRHPTRMVNKMWINLVQGIGRGKRFHNDWSTIFILDKKFNFWKNRSKKHPLVKRISDRIVST